MAPTPHSSPPTHHPHKFPTEKFATAETAKIGEDLHRALPTLEVTLIPVSGRDVTEAELRHKFPQGKVFVCDCYVDGIEKGDPLRASSETVGFIRNEVLNIDHHAPASCMQRQVSSGNLAASYVREHGPIKDAPVVINHVDCDSAISSAIMRGALPPHRLFEDAVVAADHRGESNRVADLLQALDSQRNLTLSLGNLAKLLKGEPLDLIAQEKLTEREQERARAKEIYDRGDYERRGGLIWIVGRESISGEFLTALFPEAVLIAYARPRRDGKNEVKLRLGAAAPEGFSLLSLGLRELDPAFGGRWNAGSNKRGGYTSKPYSKYCSELHQLLDRQLARS